MKKIIFMTLGGLIALVMVSCGGGGDAGISTSGRWSGSARFTPTGVGTTVSRISSDVGKIGLYIAEDETLTFHFEMEGNVNGTTFEGVITDGVGQSFGFTGSFMDDSVLLVGNTQYGTFSLEGTVYGNTMTLSGNYYVEDTPGNLTADMTGSLDDEDDVGDCEKITICHIPPGNPNNCHTITICIDDVDDHLAHGDYIGSCDGPCGDDATDGKENNKGKGKGKGLLK